MVFDGRWKYVHVELMRPMLFDLQTDPQELHDLGGDPAYAGEIERLRALHFAWARQHHTRITRAPHIVESMTEDREPSGIYIAYWDTAELEEAGLEVPRHLQTPIPERS